MSRTAGDKALEELQQEQSRLLNKIDELRTIGVGGLVELPQLIVCGNQSSGKSSVLEAISRVRFPAKSNVCTRFATEVILRRNPSLKIKISIEPGPSRAKAEEQVRLRSFNHEEFSKGDDLPALIEKAKEWMGISDSVGSGFSDDVLKVEISGPDKPELTLVDLPGLYYSTSKDQGLDGIRIVRSLTEKYMKNSRSIILAVISAKTDYHLQEVLNIAELFDPKRERTLGIVTQPDTLEASSEDEGTYLDFINNEKIRLQIGWHVVRNRSFETRDISDDARDEREREFFNQGRWVSLPRDCVGVGSLRRRLSVILFQHIRRNLPGLIGDIEEKISDKEQKLSKLGPARSNLQQQKGFLLNVSSNFEQITSQALSGMYLHEFFGGLDKTAAADDHRRIRAIIRQLNEFFADAMSVRGYRRTVIGSTPSPAAFEWSSNPYVGDWKPEYVTRRGLEHEIGEQARRNRGIELPGSANQLLVGSLFRDQSKPWEELARTHLLNTWESVRYFVFLVLQHLTDEHTYALLVSSMLEPKLEEMRQGLLDKLEELTAYTKRGHPLPIGRSFLTQIQKARGNRLLESLKGKLADTHVLSTLDAPSGFSIEKIEKAISDSASSRDEFAAAEILDQMQAYYDTAIVTFVDNVATLAIENILLDPLQRIFTSRIINAMEDDEVRNLAAEPSYIAEERERLTKELEKLRAGLRTFNVFQPLKPSLGTASLFATKNATAKAFNSGLPPESAPSHSPAAQKESHHRSKTRVAETQPGRSASLGGTTPTATKQTLEQRLSGQGTASPVPTHEAVRSREKEHPAATHQATGVQRNASPLVTSQVTGIERKTTPTPPQPAVASQGTVNPAVMHQVPAGEFTGIEGSEQGSENQWTPSQVASQAAISNRRVRTAVSPRPTVGDKGKKTSRVEGKATDIATHGGLSQVQEKPAGLFGTSGRPGLLFGKPQASSEPSPFGPSPSLQGPATPNPQSLFGSPTSVRQAIAVDQKPPFSQRSPFSGASSFGQPTTVDQKAPPTQRPTFGSSLFGSSLLGSSSPSGPGTALDQQPSSTQRSGFGPTSSFGQANFVDQKGSSQPSLFDRESPFGQTTTSDWEPPSMPSSDSDEESDSSQQVPFGRLGAFGQPTKASDQQNAPNQPSMFGTSSGFGKATGFGQEPSSSNPSGFGGVFPRNT